MTRWQDQWVRVMELGGRLKAILVDELGGVLHELVALLIVLRADTEFLERNGFLGNDGGPIDDKLFDYYDAKALRPICESFGFGFAALLKIHEAFPDHAKWQETPLLDLWEEARNHRDPQRDRGPARRRTIKLKDYLALQDRAKTLELQVRKAQKRAERIDGERAALEEKIGKLQARIEELEEENTELRMQLEEISSRQEELAVS